MNPYRTLEELEKDAILDYQRVMATVLLFEKSQSDVRRLEGECEQATGRAVAAESSEELVLKQLDYWRRAAENAIEGHTRSMQWNLELQEKLARFEHKEFEAERAPVKQSFWSNLFKW